MNFEHYRLLARDNRMDDILQSVRRHGPECENGHNFVHAIAAEGTGELIAGVFSELKSLLPLVNSRNASGESPLFYAACFANAPGVRALAQLGADLEARASNGATALLCAAGRMHAAALEALLDAGADPNGRDSSGSALEHAAECLRRNCAFSQVAPIIELLLEAGADPGAPCKNGRSFADEFCRAYPSIDIELFKNLRGRGSIAERASAAEFELARLLGAPAGRACVDLLASGCAALSEQQAAELWDAALSLPPKSWGEPAAPLRALSQALIAARRLCASFAPQPAQKRAPGMGQR